MFPAAGLPPRDLVTVTGSEGRGGMGREGMDGWGMGGRGIFVKGVVGVVTYNSRLTEGFRLRLRSADINRVYTRIAERTNVLVPPQRVQSRS